MGQRHLSPWGALGRVEGRMESVCFQSSVQEGQETEIGKEGVRDCESQGYEGSSPLRACKWTD